MKLFLTTCFLLLFFFSNAQKVKLKGNSIFIDAKVVLSFEKENASTQLYAYTIDSNNLAFSIQRIDDFVKIYFPKSQQVIETESLSGYSFKKFIELFIKRNIIDKDGNINEAKIADFVKQYHENISNRTILVK